MRQQSVLRLFLCLGLSSAACEGMDAEVQQTEPVQGQAVSGAPPMKPMTNVETVKVVSDGTDDEQLQTALKLSGARRYSVVRDNAAARGATGNGLAAVATGTQYVGVVTKKGHYILETDAQALNARFAGGPKKAEPGSAGERGWSNAVDNRVRQSSVPNQQGQVNTGCSGALIGRRLVRTAAHCVISHNTTGGAPTASVTFDSGRNGTATVWATDTTGFYYYGGNYISQNCALTSGSDYWYGYRNNWTQCGLEDWAILILGDNWYSEAGSISWYGYQGLGSSEVGTDLTSGGYPGCDDYANPDGTNNEGSMLEDPANCRFYPRRFYQDTSARCEIGQFLTNYSRFKTGCDTNGGNSGGPVLRRGTGYLLGHCQWQDCGTCSSGNNYPNTFFGHNDWMFNFQNDLRNQYP